MTQSWQNMKVRFLKGKATKPGHHPFAKSTNRDGLAQAFMSTYGKSAICFDIVDNLYRERFFIGDDLDHTQWLWLLSIGQSVCCTVSVVRTLSERSPVYSWETWNFPCFRENIPTAWLTQSLSVFKERKDQNRPTQTWFLVWQNRKSSIRRDRSLFLVFGV